MMQGGREQKKESTSLRRKAEVMTILPSTSTALIWKTCFARSRPTVVTEFKLTLALPICGAPLKTFDSANLPRLFHREDRCERRPHHQESLRALAKRHGVNPKTVAKWKARSSVSDLPTGLKQPRSTVLSAEEEAVVVAFRRHTLLPLDDCLYALQPTIPHLTRSSLHRCLQRHGISRLPQVEGEASAKRKFKAYPIGYFHIDLAEVRTA